jgi:ABC-2 type transport system permease protein
MNGLRLYFRYAAVSIRSQLQYRASLAMQTIGAFLVTGVEALAIWALFDRFGNVRGWTLAELALFYGMISIAWSLCDALGRGLEVFGTLVKGGEVDRLLLRPRRVVLQLLGHELTLRRVGRLAQGSLVLAYALASPGVTLTAPKLVLLVGAIAGTVCTFLGLLLLQATSAFWTIESLEVWNAFTYGGLTMGQYPLPIYRPWFRALFLYAIPLGTVCYLPGVAILGRPDPLGAPALVQWLAPLAGPAFLALSLLAWRAGVRHYRSTGS